MSAAAARETLPVIKILVVGDAGVGKTSVIHRYVANTSGGEIVHILPTLALGLGRVALDCDWVLHGVDILLYVGSAGDIEGT